jgi:hypothetical protein
VHVGPLRPVEAVSKKEWVPVGNERKGQDQNGRSFRPMSRGRPRGRKRITSKRSCRNAERSRPERAPGLGESQREILLPPQIVTCKLLHMGIAFRLNLDVYQAFLNKKGQKQSNSREKMQNSVNYYLIGIAMNFLRRLSYFRRISVSETLKATFLLFRLALSPLRGNQAPPGLRLSRDLLRAPRRRKSRVDYANPICLDSFREQKL